MYTPIQCNFAWISSKCPSTDLSYAVSCTFHHSTTRAYNVESSSYILTFRKSFLANPTLCCNCSNQYSELLAAGVASDVTWVLTQTDFAAPELHSAAAVDFSSRRTRRARLILSCLICSRDMPAEDRMEGGRGKYVFSAGNTRFPAAVCPNWHNRTKIVSNFCYFFQRNS